MAINRPGDPVPPAFAKTFGGRAAMIADIAPPEGYTPFGYLREAHRRYHQRYPSLTARRTFHELYRATRSELPPVRSVRLMVRTYNLD